MAVDFYTELGKVRLKIGDFNEPFYLVDDIIAMTLEDYVNESSEAVRVWKTSLDCLQILISEAANNASRLREREGGVEIEDYRNQRYEALQKRYQDLLDNPPPEAYSDDATLIIIGGTSCKERQRIRNDLDVIRPPAGIRSFTKDAEYIPQRGDDYEV